MSSTSTPAATGSPSRPETATLIRGGAVGVVAFLLGYLLAYATAADAVTRVLRGFVPSGTSPGWQFAPQWKAVGWLFFDAHFVGTHVPGTPRLFDLVGVAGVQYLYVLPPLLLVVAGALVARLAGATTTRAGLQAGMTVTVGYLLAVVVGLLLVGFVGIGPNPLRALVVAGLVYPVAFGALGGALTGALAAERRGPTGEREGVRTP